jgi:hypothetical protein
LAHLPNGSPVPDIPAPDIPAPDIPAPDIPAPDIPAPNKSNPHRHTPHVISLKQKINLHDIYMFHSSEKTMRLHYMRQWVNDVYGNDRCTCESSTELIRTLGYSVSVVQIVTAENKEFNCKSKQ